MCQSRSRISYAALPFTSISYPGSIAEAKSSTVAPTVGPAVLGGNNPDETLCQQRRLDRFMMFTRRDPSSTTVGPDLRRTRHSPIHATTRRYSGKHAGAIGSMSPAESRSIAVAPRAHSGRWLPRVSIRRPGFRAGSVQSLPNGTMTDAHADLEKRGHTDMHDRSNPAEFSIPIPSFLHCRLII